MIVQLQKISIKGESMKRSINALWHKMLALALILPISSFAEATDEEVLTRPITLVQKVIYMLFAIGYGVIAMLWILFPALTSFMIVKHYKNKQEQGGQTEISGDMNKALIVGNIIAIIAAFFTIGLLGNMFFPTDSGSMDIIAGIKAYYGNFMTSIRDAFFGAGGGGAAGGAQQPPQIGQ